MGILSKSRVQLARGFLPDLSDARTEILSAKLLVHIQILPDTFSPMYKNREHNQRPYFGSRAL